MVQIRLVIIGVLVAVALIVASSSVFIVTETQQVIILQFGKPVGEPIETPGLHFKMPFIQDLVVLEKRFLEWDGDPNQLPTKDKRFIWVDTYARWQISDPLKFRNRLTNELSAQSKLDDILDGETRNTIARHDLIELVRNTNRKFDLSDDASKDQGDQSHLSIEYGKKVMETEVLMAAQERGSDLGITILDFRFKRLNYVREVRAQVYERMKSERKRIAERFRSDGDGEAARISGEKDRELKRISSAAYKEAETIRGDADAQAADIYAKAFNRDPEFYRFIKTMETYLVSLDPETVLLLDTEGEFLRYLERSK
jgi:membrane protease subunit HflC